MLPPPGVPSTLGDFKIEAVLGQGGSGIVYDATWGPRRVALKVLNPALVGTGKECVQFLAEAQLLQQIGHPSVVKVLAVGQLPDGRPYLAMERLDGETLASVIARGALPVAQALELFGELTSAVAALHERGLIHRDLKPENVFIVAGRHAVLLDFGIAKDLAAPASTTTQEGNVRGTPAYMAPERFFGQPAGIATDVYELALVLYAMLAGRLPWTEIADPEARLSPRPLVELAPVAEALDVEIRRALSTRVQNRPASATALHAAVLAAAAGTGAEPTAAETARMRSGGMLAPEVPAGVPEQQTPLAWAPTLAAPSTQRQGTRKMWPWIAGSIAVVAAAGTFAYVRLSTSPRAVISPTTKVTAPVPIASGSDPWAEHAVVEEPVKALPLVEGKLTPETYRAEALAAIQRLPADTRVVISVQLGELRAQSATADLLGRFVKHPKVKMFAATMPPCVRAVASDAEWVVYGAASLETGERGAMVVRGRWKRHDVEACFADAMKPTIVKDGAKLFRIGDIGWLDFVDDHTAYVTMRDDLEPESVHALVRHGAGPQASTRDLVGKLPADRSIAFIADGRAKDDWSNSLAIPTGSDVFGWIRIDPAGVTLDFAADTHDDATAKAAVAKLAPQLDGLFGTARTDAVGKLEVVRAKNTVHVKGTMTSLMLSMVSAALDH